MLPVQAFLARDNGLRVLLFTLPAVGIEPNPVSFVQEREETTIENEDGTINDKETTATKSLV